MFGIDDLFWKDRGLACDVLRREYGLDADVVFSDELYEELQELWMIDAMYNAEELPFEALVLRPVSFNYRWMHASGMTLDRDEAKCYYGRKRFAHVTRSNARAGDIRKEREQAGILSL